MENVNHQTQILTQNIYAVKRLKTVDNIIINTNYIILYSTKKTIYNIIIIYESCKPQNKQKDVEDSNVKKHLSLQRIYKRLDLQRISLFGG